jgi:hypothetical protein
MEEHEQQRYTQGFNYGYLIAKHRPDMAVKITAHTENQSPYFKGFVSGKQQYDSEMREWARSFTKGRGSRDENRNPGKER